MPFPVFAKTWQFDINNALPMETSGRVNAQVLIKTIKDIMKGFSSNPWTVQYSCNAANNGPAAAASGAAGTAGDGVDRWTVANTADGANSTNDVCFNTAGNRHGWFVLRQTGIGTNFEVCFDLNNNGTSSMSVIISPSAGFTGGTATARPTATDETVLFNGGNLFQSTANQRHVVHGWQSSDGQCTRIAVWTAGSTNDLFIIFDKGQNPVGGWTTPSFFCVAQGATFTNLGTGTVIKMRGAGATPNFGGTFTSETYANGTQLRSATGIGTNPNTFNDEWPVLPMGVAASATGNAGRLCNVYDLWWKPDGINNGDTMPYDLDARSLVALGHIILPWPGDSTVPLLA